MSDAPCFDSNIPRSPILTVRSDAESQNTLTSHLKEGPRVRTELTGQIFLKNVKIPSDKTVGPNSDLDVPSVGMIV
jgi:hypothetical protein